MNDLTGSGDVYTMAEAARLKGVSYHTVSRAVRRGKLPATRLGRMALITSEDLREWRPMRERAPRKYRRREPNPEATPALLDLASAERVELASRLASLYEALFAAATDMPRDEFFGLVADRLAGTLGLRRVAIRLLDETGGRTVRVATYGPPLTNLPEETAIDDSPLMNEISRPPKAVVEDLSTYDVPEGRTLNVNSLMIAPIRHGARFAGVIVADRNGEPFRLDEGELDLAQALANVAALALDCVETTHEVKPV
ncbi:MAG: helix-turn-helix domain-containing protein [Chloroflexia bacterium]|nr:helix-turn-helix domain-containing protein [Chloroflexia bacterium]